MRLLILFLIFPVMLFADVQVRWGEGQLQIIDLSDVGNIQGELDLLQTKLLIDDDLSEIILSKDNNQENIKYDSVKGDINSLSLLIKNTLVKKATVAKDMNEQDVADPPADEDEDKNYEIENVKSLVIVGSDDEYLVKEGEVVQHLVVAGGKVKIAGEVVKLVLVKGDVEVLPTGKISQKITELAGTINVDQGGFVTKDKQGMLDDFNFSNVIINPLTDFSGTTAKLALAFIRFIQVLFLLWLAHRIIPYFNEKLVNKKYSWAKEAFTGILHLCVMPFLIFVLSITFVGLSIVPLYVFLLYALGLLGYGLLSSILGNRVMEKFKPDQQHSFFVNFLIGFLIFEACILMPVFGFIILSALVIVSVGLMTNVFLNYKNT